MELTSKLWWNNSDRRRGRSTGTFTCGIHVRSDEERWLGMAWGVVTGANPRGNIPAYQSHFHFYSNWVPHWPRYAFIAGLQSAAPAVAESHWVVVFVGSAFSDSLSISFPLWLQQTWQAREESVRGVELRSVTLRDACKGGDISLRTEIRGTGAHGSRACVFGPFPPGLCAILAFSFYLIASE